MKRSTKKLLFLSFLLIGGFAQAQVGVGTTTPQGALDVSSTTDGLLIPRIALTNTTTATVTSPTASELVYNTATVNDVTPGFYYWSGSQWVRVATGTNNDWSLTGNAGTTPGTNFIGTTDAKDLRFKTNGTDRLNILNSNGQLQSYNNTNLASAPSYSWAADTNTGMYLGGSDILAFAANGTNFIAQPFSLH